MISVEILSRDYGNFSALKGVSFRIAKGEIVGFLGPNGAGKTTTMRIITGSLAPSSGQIFLDGEPLEKNWGLLKEKLGYLPESAPAYPEMQVETYLSFVAQIRQLNSTNSVSKVMDRCGLNEMAKRPIGHLSKGFRQRVGLAQALIHDPEILILDEPSSGLDPNQIQEMMNLIRSFAGEKTILFSSHILAEVEAVANRILVLNEGQLVADGQLDELRAQASEGQIKLRVGGEQSEGLADQLIQIPGVRTIDATPISTHETLFLIAIDPSKSPSAHIARAVIESNGQLLEMSDDSDDLDQLFGRLTRGDK